MDLWNVVQARTRSKVSPTQLTSHSHEDKPDRHLCITYSRFGENSKTTSFIYCDSYKNHFYNKISHLKISKGPSYEETQRWSSFLFFSTELKKKKKSLSFFSRSHSRNTNQVSAHPPRNSPKNLTVTSSSTFSCILAFSLIKNMSSGKI